MNLNEPDYVFRCPHCGEYAFTVADKLGNTSYLSIYSKRCPFCKKYSHSKIAVGIGSKASVIAVSIVSAVFGFIYNDKDDGVYFLVFIIGIFCLLIATAVSVYRSPLFPYKYDDSSFIIARCKEKRFLGLLPRIRTGEILDVQPADPHLGGRTVTQLSGSVGDMLILRVIKTERFTPQENADVEVLTERRIYDCVIERFYGADSKRATDMLNRIRTRNLILNIVTIAVVVMSVISSVL